MRATVCHDLVRIGNIQHDRAAAGIGDRGSGTFLIPDSAITRGWSGSDRIAKSSSAPSGISNTGIE